MGYPLKIGRQIWGLSKLPRRRPNEGDRETKYLRLLLHRRVWTSNYEFLEAPRHLRGLVPAAHICPPLQVQSAMRFWPSLICFKQGETHSASKARAAIRMRDIQAVPNRTRKIIIQRRCDPRCCDGTGVSGEQQPMCSPIGKPYCTVQRSLLATLATLSQFLRRLGRRTCSSSVPYHTTYHPHSFFFDALCFSPTPKHNVPIIR